MGGQPTSSGNLAGNGRIGRAGRVDIDRRSDAGQSRPMKRLINAALRSAGVQIVRSTTLDGLRSELAALREASSVHNIYGHTVYCDPEDRGVRLAPLARTAIEDSEDNFFLRTLKPGQTALDLGANIGIYSLLFARAVGPAGLVYSFEPGPKSIALLKKNIAVSQYQNIRPENCAVSDASGIADFYLCREGESDNRLDGTLVDHDARDRISVRTVAIDDYVSQGLAGGQVALVKMDIQGAELRALRGMEKTMRLNAAISIVMEYGPGGIITAGSTPGGLLDYLSSLGFRFFTLNPGGEATLTSRTWLLENVGQPHQPQHINILLRR